jgi:cell division protein FtsB
MRREAKDLGKLQMSNEALKEEIEQLRARAKDDTRRVLEEAGERSVVSR